MDRSLATAATGLRAQTGGTEKAGAVEKIKVHGTSLEGNLEGDPAEREVFGYLPPNITHDLVAYIDSH